MLLLRFLDRDELRLNLLELPRFEEACKSLLLALLYLENVFAGECVDDGLTIRSTMHSLRSSLVCCIYRRRYFRKVTDPWNSKFSRSV